MKYILIIFTIDDEKAANSLAGNLVEKGLVACAQVSSPLKSHYQWNNKLETALEFQVYLKTQLKHEGAVYAFIKEHHPYEVPELISIEIANGLPAYLAWINQETLN